MASSTKPHQRVFIILMAVVFLVTTVATSGFIVYSLINEGKNKDSASSEAADQLSKQDINSKEGDRMQGTKLKDFKPVDNVTALQKLDLKTGNGEEVKPGATVTAHYTGAVASTGIIFQSSHDSGSPIPFSLDGVIKGWTEGVPGMKVGGTRRLIIPADLAYGVSPPAGSGIPANAALVFDIELTEVKNP